MIHPVRSLLLEQTDEVWRTLRQRLAGLTDHEYFWEPVRGCWTVHRDDAGRWVSDYDDPAPDPPPFATIAWRLSHLVACKTMYYEYAFGLGRLTWDDLPTPTSAAEAIAALEANHAHLRQTLAALNDSELATTRATNWGEQWPTWRLFWTLIFHDAHHGAEIACLRDLYRATQDGTE